MIWIIGAVLMLIGTVGYTGVWRSWAKDGLSYWVFGLFWFGLGIVPVSVVLATDAPTWVFWIPATLTVLGAAATWYLPPALTPRWFREQRRNWC
ncbi:hypothetical protein ACLBWP_04560 [Microbacterium sp. M1A1_1b]